MSSKKKGFFVTKYRKLTYKYLKKGTRGGGEGGSRLRQAGERDAGDVIGETGLISNGAQFIVILTLKKKDRRGRPVRARNITVHLRADV